jgi:hypothetical protein
MKTRTRRLCATMSFLLLSLAPSPTWAGEADELRRTEQITRERVAAANAAVPSGATGRRLAELAEKASTDGRALAELYRMQAEYVDRATGEWRDGAERKKLQEASSLLQKNTERINSSLTIATEAAKALSARIGQSGVLEKMAQLETAAKEAGARLAGRWELERAAREREREQRERQASERERAQRR